MEYLPSVRAPSSPPINRTLIACSPPLRRLLCDEVDNDRAIRAIACDRELLAEANRISEALDAHAGVPAGVAGVMDVIGRRFALYRQPERTQAEAQAWWEAYSDVLADVPLGSLEAAMIAWLRTGAEFLPKPGQLLALVGDNPGKDVLASLRARAAVRWRPPEIYREVEYQQPPQVTAENRQAIRAMAASFAKQIPTRTKAATKPQHGKTDARGVTPELRALMERRGHDRP